MSSSCKHVLSMVRKIHQYYWMLVRIYPLPYPLDVLSYIIDGRVVTIDKTFIPVVMAKNRLRWKLIDNIPTPVMWGGYHAAIWEVRCIKVNKQRTTFRQSFYAVDGKFYKVLVIILAS